MTSAEGMDLWFPVVATLSPGFSRSSNTVPEMILGSSVS